MKKIYSRRDFLNKTSVALAGAGTASALSGVVTAANTSADASNDKITDEHEASMGMSDTSDYNAREFAHSLKGIGFNLLVTDVMASVEFAEKVLLATAGRADKFSAVLNHRDFWWMYHLDWTYRDNPLSARVKDVDGRGRGVELRLYDQDPDEAEQRARDNGYKVLAETVNKPHGLRECFLLDPDGYCWVISRDLREDEK